jgi:hypothetical protein
MNATVRRQIRRAITAGAVTAAITAGGAAASATSAQAVAYPVASVQATIAAPRTTISVTTLTTTRARPGAIHVTLTAPGLGVVGYSTQPGPGAVTIVASPLSSKLTPGTSTWTLTDLVDRKTYPVRVTFRRTSVIHVDWVDGVGGSQIGYSVKVSHLTPTGYTASKLSPVWVQRLVAGRWVTAATVTTDSFGRVTGLVSAPTGRAVVRFVRPVGATVTGAATPGRAVVVIAEGC